MILHSVAPLSLLLPQEETIPQESISTGSMSLLGRHTPQGFLISRVISTDPSVYLRGSCMPGSIYTGAAKQKSEASYRFFSTAQNDII